MYGFWQKDFYLIRSLKGFGTFFYCHNLKKKPRSPRETRFEIYYEYDFPKSTTDFAFYMFYVINSNFNYQKQTFFECDWPEKETSVLYIWEAVEK
jgi:hypothetical protein